MTILELLADGDPNIAVVGATDDPHKYGSVIYRDLKAKGYAVYPVSTTRATVDGDRAYRDLGDLPVVPDIVDVVVPPEEALAVVRRCVELGLDHVWLQPGAESPEVLAYLTRHDVDHLANACIMVRSRLARRPR